MQLTNLLLVLLVNIILAHGIPTDDDDNDCCQLEWLPLIEYNSKRSIPSTAFLAATSSRGTSWYYFKSPDAGHGIINDVLTDEPGFIPAGINPKINGRIAGSIVRTPWTGGFILSNPNKCVVGWHSKGDIFEANSMQKQFSESKSSEGSNSFLRSSRHNGFDVGYFRNHTGFSISIYDWTISSENSFDQLYVDCKASLMNQLSAELYDIDTDKKELSRENVTLTTTELMNFSYNDSMAPVELAADVFTSVEMEHETHLHTVAETKWGVHSSPRLKLVEELLFPQTSSEEVKHSTVESGYDSSSIKKEFTTNGSIKLDYLKRNYKFNQSIYSPKRTRTKVAIKAQSLQGSQKFTAYYRLQPKAPRNKFWTPDRIMNSLKRIGFSDSNKIQKVNNTLIVAYEGFMSINGAHGIYIEIETRSFD